MGGECRNIKRFIKFVERNPEEEILVARREL
jgi:hypothetical protein